ncbi:MAG: alpha/beta fold hydrolase [Patescibacteria group bacterium]
MARKRVLLIQGMGGSWIMFPRLAWKIWRAGFLPKFYAPEFWPIADWRPHAQAVAALCRQLAHDSHKPVAVIGYSMGGLIAVDALLNHGAVAYIDTVIAIGSPFYGTPVANLAAKLFGRWYPSLQQMSKKSPEMAALCAPPPFNKRLYCFGGRYDLLVWGPMNAHHPFADKNIVVPASHLLLPFVAEEQIVALIKDDKIFPVDENREF